MAPLQKELSSLEVQPLEIGVHTPEPVQDRNLDTLTSTTLVPLLTSSGVFTNDGTYCCCCCCPICCC